MLMHLGGDLTAWSTPIIIVLPVLACEARVFHSTEWSKIHS